MIKTALRATVVVALALPLAAGWACAVLALVALRAEGDPRGGRDET